MRTLEVENFSVIKKAAIEFGRITVLIGPQSSGKSILCKLAFFSHNLLLLGQNTIEEEGSYERFLQVASEEFAKLFPSQSWGSKRFKIRYRCGGFAVDIVRKRYKRDPKDKAAFLLPTWFAELYKTTHHRIQTGRKRQGDPLARAAFRRDFSQRARLKLGPEWNSDQLFIPAGRSFFSSVGKALAAFEEGGSIDPLTLRFGRQVNWNFDEYSFLNRTKHVSELSKLLKDESSSLLGGSVREERSKTVFVSSDGRILPLSNLSSGQQELLPLLSTLARRIRWEMPQMLFIEEPEAHLFPSAQASLVSLFASIAQDTRPNISIVLTTHSPYILSKFNNLIMAGQLSKKRALRASVEKIIKPPFWVKEGNIRAYSIENGGTTNIIDSSGLINGEYLDRVSELIGREFDELLRLEYEHTKGA
jgi:ABC-type cobalamin/Fe3+-siderophores transport system ATPase subunit